MAGSEFKETGVYHSLRQAERHRPYRLHVAEGARGIGRALLALGLAQGCDIKVMRHQAGGGAVVARGGLRVALGPALAASLRVSPLGDCDPA